MIATGEATDPTEVAPYLLDSGIVVIWTDVIGNIPAGWVICDGNNSTENLLAHFLVGYNTNPVDGGGAIAQETSSHSHDVDAYLTVSAEIGTDTGALITISCAVEHDDIDDIRPPYVDVAFIMKT